MVGSTPAVYLLPGFHGSTKLFSPLLHALSDDIETYALSFNSCASITDHAAKLAAELPISGSILLAESFSSLIALQLAADFPDRFKGLILSTPFARTPMAMLARLGACLPAFVYRNSPIRKYVLDRYCLNGVADVELRTNVLNAINEVAPATVKSRIKVLSNTDLSAVLPAITAPCLLLEATKDRVVPKNRIEELHRHLSTNRRVQINGPHLILQAKPKEAAAAIKQFIHDFVAR